MHWVAALTSITSFLPFQDVGPMGYQNWAHHLYIVDIPCHKLGKHWFISIHASKWWQSALSNAGPIMITSPPTTPPKKKSTHHEHTNRTISHIPTTRCETCKPLRKHSIFDRCFLYHLCKGLETPPFRASPPRPGPARRRPMAPQELEHASSECLAKWRFLDGGEVIEI